MGELLDEFNFLIEEEVVTTFEEDSKNLVQEALRFIDKGKQFPNNTYQGIKLSSIIECISIGESEIIPWEHVKFTLNVNKLKSIANDRLESFVIPSFVEELESIGEKDGTEFGYNQSGRNNLKSIFIPSNVIVIAPNTFTFYKKLSSVKFEEESKLIYLGKQSFLGCESLNTLDLRNCTELDYIPEDSFISSGLEVLKISNNMQDKINFNELLKNSNIKTLYIDIDKIKIK